MDPERIKLPGFGLPLNHHVDAFRSAIIDWQGKALTVRELNMIQLMNQTTNKPSWDRKVYDETITEKWRGKKLVMLRIWILQKPCLIG